MKRIIETKLMNSPMMHMAKMKLKTNKMEESISLVGNQQYAQ